MTGPGGELHPDGDGSLAPGRPGTVMAGEVTLPAPTLDAAALQVLPGVIPLTDPFVQLAAAFLAGQSPATARAYTADLRSWAAWCAQLGVHPLTARRHHADAGIRDQYSRGISVFAARAARACVGRTGGLELLEQLRVAHRHRPDRRPSLTATVRCAGRR